MKEYQYQPISIPYEPVSKIKMCTGGSKMCLGKFISKKETLCIRCRDIKEVPKKVEILKKNVGKIEVNCHVCNKVIYRQVSWGKPICFSCRKEKRRQYEKQRYANKKNGVQKL